LILAPPSEWRPHCHLCSLRRKMMPVPRALVVPMLSQGPSAHCLPQFCCRWRWTVMARWLLLTEQYVVHGRDKTGHPLLILQVPFLSPAISGLNARASCRRGEWARTRTRHRRSASVASSTPSRLSVSRRVPALGTLSRRCLCTLGAFTLGPLERFTVVVDRTDMTSKNIDLQWAKAVGSILQVTACVQVFE
jgi:hypothetical protein